jgi:hypothetical protein
LLQVKVVPLRSVVGPDLSLPSDPDWSLALVGLGVLATVVEGTARCLMCWVALPRRIGTTPSSRSSQFSPRVSQTPNDGVGVNSEP